MWLVRWAMRRPVTIVVAVLAVMLGAGLAVQRMPVDIFPQVGAPAIYVAQPYGGMDPLQMEGFMTYYYEYHFLYITGIERVESKSIQGAALMKLVFYPGTDMNQAMAQTISYVNRARAFMPPGAVPPFVTRFDAGSVPVGQLIFSSAKREPGELQNLALNSVRPLFATLPGVSAPPPFGGNQRTIVVRLDPDKLRQYRMSPEEVIEAVNKSTTVMPSGLVRTGDLARYATTNSVISGNFDELNNAPIRLGSGPTVFIRDVGKVENGTDIVTAYALVNGKRTVYMQVTKRSDASTLAVIQAVRANIARFKAVVPDDVDVRLEFDQSVVVLEALRSLAAEGALGALLTGLMVLLFLRDWRGAVIVMATIPAALLAASVCLWLTGQSINIMTLGGLALAVGVLVDEATVEIENIHSRLAAGGQRTRAHAVMEACSRTATARFLSMCAILAAFVPSFFMTGVARQLFVPLSLAVAFAMVSSYVLSSTLVPVLSTWWMRDGGHRAFAPAFYQRYVASAVEWRWPLAVGYLAITGVGLWLLAPKLGVELFPQTFESQFQVRLRAATGTRIEKTEQVALKALEVIKQEVGAGNVAITSTFVGVQPPSYPINTLFLWTSGPHEAVLLVALKPEAALRGEPLRERLRQKFSQALPDVRVSFEAGEIVSQVMSFGSPTPLEVAVQGPSLAANRTFAGKVEAELKKLPYLRDLAYAQPLDYPTLDITIDRERAGQFGLTMASVARSVVAGTFSSRFIDANYWRDPVSGNGFQIQVEIPYQRMASMEDVARIPVMRNGEARPLLEDVAKLKFGTAPGQTDRFNGQRVVSLTANLHEMPLGTAAEDVRAAIKRAGEVPKGITVNVRGQVPPLDETVSGLRLGLALAIAALVLLLAANFQSIGLALAIVLTLPAVLLGVVAMLLATGTTLNIQSFMGAIMSTGIAVANAILLVTFAERARASSTPAAAAVEGATGRLRAILMTALAMVAGMAPLALGQAQTAPLGRAVIGGLLAGTVATLAILPALYALLSGQGSPSPSLDPNDPESRFYEAA
ncbi:MAG: efflux RND transporter permease subunit [Acidobacteria bacterium]|nr:efflux RND transporter permease subunit [Acidobacteriota bacterium]